MDCSPPGFSVHRILQARILEWLPFPSPLMETILLECSPWAQGPHPSLRLCKFVQPPSWSLIKSGISHEGTRYSSALVSLLFVEGRGLRAKLPKSRHTSIFRPPLCLGGQVRKAFLGRVTLRQSRGCFSRGWQALQIWPCLAPGQNTWVCDRPRMVGMWWAQWMQVS